MSMTIWTEGPTHNNGIKKPPASRCSVVGDIDADPSTPNHHYSEYAKTGASLTCNLPLTGDTLVTYEGILTFEM